MASRLPGLSGQGNAAIANQKLSSQTIDHTLNYTANLTQKINVEALVGMNILKRMPQEMASPLVGLIQI